MASLYFKFSFYSFFFPSQETNHLADITIAAGAFMDTSSQKDKHEFTCSPNYHHPRECHIPLASTSPGQSLPIPRSFKPHISSDLLYVWIKWTNQTRVLLSVPKIWFPAAEKTFPAQRAHVRASPKRIAGRNYFLRECLNNTSQQLPVEKKIIVGKTWKAK